MSDYFELPNGSSLKNRLVFAPISTMSSNAWGQLSSEELAFYTARSHYVGMLILGSATISPKGKAYENNVSIANDALIPNLKKYNRAVKKKGARSIIQLYHGGKAVTFLGKQKSVAVVSEKGDSKQHELTDTDIQEILFDFGKAIVRAVKSGFDGVEIHAGNPFLIQEFLSPLSNQRQDRWGNRSYFLEQLLKLAAQIRAELAPTFIIGVRLAIEERATGGLTVTDTAEIVAHVSKLGIDYIHFNSDDARESRVHFRAFQKAAGTVPIIANGGIKDTQTITELLQEVPLVSVARPLILNAHFPNKGESGPIPPGLKASIAASKEWYYQQP